MEIYFVRHGETYLNKYDRMQGWADTPLTHQGRISAEKCGAYLASKGISQIVSSDLGRTIETSKIIRTQLNITKELYLMPEFRETFFGYFEGELNQNVWPKVAKSKGFETVNEFYANLKINEVMNAFHEADPQKDAEDYETFITRIKAGLEKLENTFFSDSKILVVTHGNTIRNLAYLIDPQIDCAEVVLNAAITKIALTKHEKKLLFYNQSVNL